MLKYGDKMGALGQRRCEMGERRGGKGGVENGNAKVKRTKR